MPRAVIGPSTPRAERGVKTTKYFDAVCQRADRAEIEQAWIELAVSHPEHEELQADGRLRRWVRVKEAGNRWLRVVVLEDGMTVIMLSSTEGSGREDQVLPQN